MNEISLSEYIWTMRNGEVNNVKRVVKNQWFDQLLKCFCLKRTRCDI